MNIFRTTDTTDTTDTTIWKPGLSAQPFREHKIIHMIKYKRNSLTA